MDKVVWGILPTMTNTNSQELDAENQPLSNQPRALFVNTDAYIIQSSLEIPHMFIFSKV